jgi:hypothetical protein
VVLPVRGRDHVGCLLDKVKLTCALKEMRQLGDHREKASRWIMELEPLCKQQEEVIEKLKKENTTLEGMVPSREELIMEIATRTGLNRMGGDDLEDDNDDKDDDDDRGDAAAPPTTAPPPADAAPPAAIAPELVVEEKEEDPEMMILEQEAPEVLEVILPDEEPEPPQPRLFTVLMRDYEESSSRMYDDMDDLTLVNYEVDEWIPEDGSHDPD